MPKSGDKQMSKHERFGGLVLAFIEADFAAKHAFCRRFRGNIQDLRIFAPIRTRTFRKFRQAFRKTGTKCEHMLAVCLPKLKFDRFERVFLTFGKIHIVLPTIDVALIIMFSPK